ncbi:6-phosphogluconate dehydrogenase-like protein [Rhizobium leguminosarum bv. trifolii WSM2012]|nr:6-phosphogluconate dehydrogenase-like protein [Rhizobium leguminosarum bv. trifolii WSM2012]
MPDFAIIGAGAMGSAVAKRLIEHGATVLTNLDGRSELTIARAKAAGMAPVGREELAKAELILSIVPPAEALKVAEFVAEISSGLSAPAPFLDLNAIAPKTMQALAARLAGSGVEVLDGAIIGGPPVAGKSGPTLYVSGDGAARSRLLEDYGLRVRRLDGPLGAASALKMCYAGINKGFIGLGAAILLAASRSGAAESLKAELAESLPDLDRKLSKSIPDMYPKAIAGSPKCRRSPISSERMIRGQRSSGAWRIFSPGWPTTWRMAVCWSGNWTKFLARKAQTPWSCHSSSSLPALRNGTPAAVRPGPSRAYIVTKSSTCVRIAISVGSRSIELAP